MEPVKDLIKGLEILKPFLGEHGFILESYENGKGSGGNFTLANFKNGSKRFTIGYRYSIGVLNYQFEKYIVSHSFYLDHLGLSEKKKFPDFQSDDKMLAFYHILHDLDFLVDDFFDGSCKQLIESAKLQEKYIKENNKRAQEEHKNYFDKVKISNARNKFKEKDYKGALEIYTTIENWCLLAEFDKKIIEFCKKS